MRTLSSLVVSLVCLVALAVHGGPAQAAGARLALLIANHDYPDDEAELTTPRNDVAALSEALTQRGFSVDVARNLTLDGFKTTLDAFKKRIEPGSTALIFYGGYAIQVARKNYLIPIGAKIWSDATVPGEAIGVDALLADLAKRGAETRVLVLDASRRSPFERRYRAFSTGLAAAQAQPGTLTLSAAAPGSVVNETTATRSLFVTELVKQIAVPAISAEQAFSATRDALSKATRGLQVPALVSGLDESFSFDASYVKPVAQKPAVVDQVTPSATKPAVAEQKPETGTAKLELPPDPTDPPAVIPAEPAAEPKTDPATKASAPTQMASKDPDAPAASEERALREWEDAKAIGTRQAFEDFLSRHPEGSLAAKARAEIARIDAVELAKPKVEPQQDAKADPSYTPAERARKAALDERISKNARDEQAYYERGQFYAQRGESGPAIADFDASIRMNPSNPEAYNNRCWMLAMSGALDRALADCSQALKLRPNYVDALDSRGLVNLKANKFRAAVADYDAALKIDPAHGSSLYGRGIAKRRLGLTGQAEKDLSAALQLNAGIGQEFAGYGLR